MQIIKDKYKITINTADGNCYFYTVDEDIVEKIKNQIRNQKILEIGIRMFPVTNICHICFEKIES